MPAAELPHVDVAAERRLARAQAVSGLAFGSFLALHLLNTATAALGTDAYDAVQRALRWYYRFPLVELLCVVSAALVHASCGVARALRRRRRDRALRAAGRPPLPVPSWLRWHRRSGWFLLLILVGHFLATRGPSLFLGVEIEASYLGFSLRAWPWMMYPYYCALYFGGSYHLLFGASLALRVLGPTPGIAFGLRERRSAQLCAAIAAAAGLAGVLTLGGVLCGPADSSRDAEWQAIYEEWAPFMVNWDE